MTRDRALRWLWVMFMMALPACGRKSAPGEVWLEPRPAPPLKGLDVQRGQVARLEDDRGHWVMLTFGYTSCVDVCPATLAKLHAVFSGLGADAGRVRAYYVSVDPERDQPAVFASFMTHFDQRIRGLYVEPDVLDPVLAAFGATAIKRPPSLRRYVGHDIDPMKDYSVDHSASTWIIDAQGRLRIRYAYETEPQTIVAGLRRLLEEPAPALAFSEAKLVVYGTGTGAGYFRIRNSGKEPDRLLSVEAPQARSVELHDLIREGEVVKMRPVEHGFSIPVGRELALKSGGPHVMFTGISVGDDTAVLPVVLHLEWSGAVRLDLRIERPAQEGGATGKQDAVPASRTLRVCSDPNNLPFSNRRGQGFENELAKLVASVLGVEVSYVYWPQRRGFLRMTLNAGRCDLVMGVPTGTERVLLTEPYYRSGYVFVYGPKSPRVRSFDAPELASLRIGVPVVGDDGANPPPLLALAQRKLTKNLRGYSVYGDYRKDSPPSDLVEAVRHEEVDLAVAWGPLAGYYAVRRAPGLGIAPVPESEAPPGQSFRFAIAMAVRKDDRPLRDELDRIIKSHRSQIDAVLADFGVPRL